MSVVMTVGKGMAWNTTAVVVGKFVMFANIFVILNYLTIYEYGFSELILSVISVIGVVLLPGLTHTVIADMSVERGRNNPSGMKRVFLQFFSLNVLLACFAWVVLFFGSQPVADAFGNPYAAQFLQIASFLFLISPLRAATTMLATVNLRFFDQSFYTIFEEVAKLMLLLMLVVWFQYGIHGLMYSMVFSQLAVLTCFLPRTISAYRRFGDAETAEQMHFWNMLRDHRKWSIGSSYVGTITQNLRLWMIKFFLGTEAVGLFAFAYGMYSHLTSLMPLTTVLAPIVPHYVDKREQLARIVRASIKFQIVIAFCFLVGSYAITYIFVLLLFPKYLAAVPLLYAILLTILPNSVLTLFTPVFNAFKAQRSLFFSNVLKFISVLIVLPPALSLFGIVGAGIEIFLTSTLNGLERYIRLRTLLPEMRLTLQNLFHSDAHERDAMRTVRHALLARMRLLRVASGE
jgi:O-antigen/teichoic acid export membrane protein